MWAVAAVMAAAALWGTTGTFLKLLQQAGITQMQSVAIRVSIAGTLLLLYLWRFDKQKLEVRFSDYRYFVGTGVLSLFFFSICYVYAIQWTSISVAAVLLYTSPGFVIVLSALCFKERITGRKVAALALTFLGCVLVSGLAGFGDRVPIRGVLAGLGAGLGYGLYSIFGRFALRKHHSLTITAYTFLFASLAAVPFCGITDLMAKISGSFSLALLSLGTGLFTCLLPYLLYTWGLSRMESGRASILATLEPLVATLCGVAFFHEGMTAAKIGGVACILGGILVINVGVKARGGPPPEGGAVEDALPPPTAGGQSEEKETDGRSGE